MSNRAVYFVIYQITNVLNGRTYIGKHQTCELDDSYMGSGKLLKQAIYKHGIENFKKEILFIFDNEFDMNAKEAELVTEEFVSLNSNYNICVGGHGGWSYVNKKVWTEDKRIDHNRTITPFGDDGFQNKIQNDDPNKYKADRSKGGQRIQQLRKDGIYPQPWSGKTHSDKTKEKMSASSKGKSVGEKNSQYGSRWITDGTHNKKIKKDIILPDGWYFGRTVKK